MRVFLGVAGEKKITEEDRGERGGGEEKKRKAPTTVRVI